jgi:hypothetical protein
MDTLKLSPDCRDGNCAKCDGNAWDPDKDQITACQCKHHQDHETAALDPGPPWQLVGITPSGFKVFTAPTGTPPRVSDR